MSTIKFEIENKDHDVTILIGKNSIFTFNPNTRNGEELSDFLSGCEEFPDNESLRKENETIKSDNTQTLVNALDKINELESENEGLKTMLDRFMANLTFNEQGLYNEIKELLNKK